MIRTGYGVFLVYWNIKIDVLRFNMMEIRNELADNSGWKRSWKNPTLED
jgi:hypothetical protein